MIFIHHVSGELHPWYEKQMGMDQYLLIPFLVEWTSIYQLFLCSPGVQGFDTLPYEKQMAKGPYSALRLRQSHRSAGEKFLPKSCRQGWAARRETNKWWLSWKKRSRKCQIQKNDMYYIIYYIYSLYYGKPNNGSSQFYLERMGFQPSSSGNCISWTFQFRCGLEDEHFAMACWECGSFISFIAILAQRMQRMIELIPAPYYQHLGKPP